MPRAGEEIENPATGERVRFLRTAAETGGELVEMELTWTRPGLRAAPHVHPEMEERWHVRSGRACVRIGEEEHEIGPGESVTAPPGAPHVAWNPTDGEVRLHAEMRPALRWAEFVERLFTAAAEGRVDEDGRPDRELAIELMSEFSREIAPA